jgi:hypothetical protein
METGFGDNSKQKARTLESESTGEDRFMQMETFNDTRASAPEEFYKFEKVIRNSRRRLVVSNKDMFIIWG